MLGNKRPKPREAKHFAFGIVGLYQSIAVEEGTVTGIEFDLLLLVAHPRHEPQGHPSGPQFLGNTVTAA
jgi:hypothetical protein